MSVSQEFQLIKAQEIPELKTRAEFFRHVKTGLELLSLINGDENKVFGITFRTPPRDSTGVAHILEHAVLCGSRKYPVKEPFVELLKSSLQTFLNAMTYPDKTCYPVASQNVKDFYNLIDVYLDAVFYPRLTPFVLQQEGWHFELARPEDPLTYKGVVFSEMKGAYSSPDALLAEYSRESLFPDTPYGFDSGGKPDEIPNLTFEQFEAFHKTYYRPSNARVFFYGNDDPERRLFLVDEYARDFEPFQVDSGIPLQRPFESPRRISRPYPAGKESGPKGMVTMNWLLGETAHRDVNLALHVLEYILLGMPGSPLRRALIESNLGEDLAGEGLGSELRQMYFSTGLKGVFPQDVEKVEGLILDTMEGIASQGIDQKTVEAALNTIEFSLRENNTGSFPRGLSLMLRALTTWLYGGDPLALIAFETPLRQLKERVASERAFFEGMLQEMFLHNPHRTSLILEPDERLAREQEEKEQDRLARARQAMSAAQIQEVIAKSRELKQIQETPDPPEALASIPVLRLEDLDRRNKLIPLALLGGEGNPVLYHDLFTNGIAYLDLGFNLHSLPGKYLPYTRLFGRALLEMGTEEEDYVSLTQRISRKTGGIRPAFFTSVVKGEEEAAAWLFLRGKAMAGETHELMNLMRDILLKVRLDNKERFRQMVYEAKARQEQKLVPMGHQVVNLRLRAHFTESDWAAEQMGGVSYLLFLRSLAEALDKDWPRILADLEEIRQRLLNQCNVLANITLDEANWSKFQPQVFEFLEALPNAAVPPARWSDGAPAQSEGLTIPAQVNYVAKGTRVYSSADDFHGSVHVICRHLRTAWLWERVRVQGGAYGAYCLFDRLSGVLSLVSYRDPNLLKTLETFDQTAGFLAGMELTEDELAKSIIGAIGDMDRYELPDAKGYTSMVRYLSGETDEERQKMREEVLNTTVAHFKSFVGVLKRVKEQGVVKVLGSESAIQAVQSERPGWLQIVKVL